MCAKEDHMKNILIPTDFSVRSLGYVHTVIEQHRDEPVNIIYMHAMRMPDSLFELMTFARLNRHHRLMTTDFKDACEIIRNKYFSAIGSFQVEFFHGDTKAAFRNFLLARNIDVIALPVETNYHLPCSDSYNPMDLIRRSGYPLMTVKLPARTTVAARSTIADLLTAGIAG